MRLAATLATASIIALSHVPALAQAQAPAAAPPAAAAQQGPKTSIRYGDMTKRKGWHVYATKHAYSDLVKRLEAAVTKNKMAVVNAASASDGAKAQGFTIPGNRVVGVFRNDFARRMLASSMAAGIEAPIRFYLTENATGGSTISYRPPSVVFAPYITRRSTELRAIAKELDAIFAQIAMDATGG